MVCVRCKQRAAAADGPISWLRGSVVPLCCPPVLRRWVNQRMLSSFRLYLLNVICFVFAIIGCSATTSPQQIEIETIHCFDLSWICCRGINFRFVVDLSQICCGFRCTACSCTTNPQLIKQMEFDRYLTRCGTL